MESHPAHLMARVRLDQLVVARGLAPSRERARALILAGQVMAGGVEVAKAGHLVDDTAELTLRRPDHPWASRGGVKLDHALEAFAVDVADRIALDVGASTGGFTDVLLERGAARVVALDVGRGQLDWRLRTDPRVVCLEGVNARHLTAAALPDGARQFSLITVDVAFISLRHVLPALPPLLARNGRVIALVKPQFEAGRGEIGKGGIVRDPAVHARVLDEVTDAAHRVGLTRIGMTPSPIAGAEGNREFFLLLGPADGT
jgi:23S rRNA (cytidine1920-2'-O)/16S rRNA (cytidine1409-2'-O)-methyltransferase